MIGVKEEPKKEGLKKKKEPKKKDVKKIKEGAASVKTTEEKPHVKTKKMTKPEDNPAPKMVRSGYPRLQHPQRALIRSNQVKKSSYGL
jgi:hypothetical protein